MATAEFSTETEWQFDVANLATWRARLSSAAELAGFQLVAASPRNLDDCYMDTADTRIGEAGYALRLRTDGTHAEATLKSIGDDAVMPRIRTEIRQPIDARNADAWLSAPGPVSERVRALTGTAPLAPLFHVRTHRDVWHALLGEVDAAEIALDESRIAANDDSGGVELRRVEVELRDAPVESLQPLISLLTAGNELTPATHSKYQHGVAVSGRQQSGETWRHTEPVIGPDSGVIVAGQLLLRWQLQLWRRLADAVRLDADVEALHQLRVCGRRMIGTLQLMERAPLARARQLRRRLQQLLIFTSEARDLDVQCQYLAALPDAAGRLALEPLLAELRRRRRHQQPGLVRRLNARRTAQLLAGLDGLAATSIQRRFLRTAAAVSGTLLRGRYRKLRRQARRALDAGGIDAMHALRLQTRKMRYVAEPLVDIYGAPLRRFLRRLQTLQALLGELHDAEQLARCCAQQAARHGADFPMATAFAMGRLAELQQARVGARAAELADAWRRVRGKSWRQLRHALRS